MQEFKYHQYFGFKIRPQILWYSSLQEVELQHGLDSVTLLTKRIWWQVTLRLGHTKHCCFLLVLSLLLLALGEGSFHVTKMFKQPMERPMW